jgi:hypothetical protein
MWSAVSGRSRDLEVQGPLVQPLQAATGDLQMKTLILDTLTLVIMLVLTVLFFTVLGGL